MNSNESIQVFVRCRPLLESEKQLPVPVEVHPEVNKIIVHDIGCNKNAIKTFSFDKVFGPETQQAHIYNGVAAPLIQEVIMGFNCTILAYGQTGTGKTFTIEGNRFSTLDDSVEVHYMAGIIPRSMKHIFQELTQQKCDFEVNVSFLELYNEEIYDLLSKTDDLIKLKLYDSSSPKGSVIIQGLEIQK
ncbi:kinesin-like protein Klp61F [Caerostris darwini]|uniref:Kinesin-like protein Klp61F n=1 Tax=Caerostris darwini TaxID=1538125 RepID=A0AAV4QID9_9ARAC|nr:kinesin-like protein Klp61F [Caerostris darwini]